MKRKDNYKISKTFRQLNLFDALNRGEEISKVELANKFNVAPKTIQRDINDLRIFLGENYETEINTKIIYDAKVKRYKLIRPQREWITNKEVLAILKILLESRGFNKDELGILIDKLIVQVTPNDRKHINDLIIKEKFSYVEPKHAKALLDIIWDLSSFITNNEIINYTYKTQNGSERNIQVKPVAIMFSEFYFYLIAFKADKNYDYPINYRIDRITNLKSTKETFNIPYIDKFDDGDFRKKVQFMYSGKLRHIKFEFSGPSLEAILDRLPTAKIIKNVDGVYTLEADSYGDGIEMWLKTQGDNVKIL